MKKSSGAYATPSNKPLISKMPLKRFGKMSNHRKAVRDFCDIHDVSFGRDTNGQITYKVTEKNTGNISIGVVTGDE